MKIHVRYLAQLRLASGRNAEVVECPEGSTVAHLLQSLARREDRLRAHLLTAEGAVKPSLLLFIGEEQVLTERILHHQEEVTLMTPIAGGA